MSSGGWGCPHERNEMCMLLGDKVVCDPGMKGCILAGRFVFSNPEKNRNRPRPRRDARGRRIDPAEIEMQPLKRRRKLSGDS